MLKTTLFSTNLSVTHLVRMFSAQLQTHYCLKKLLLPCFLPQLYVFSTEVLVKSNT